MQLSRLELTIRSNKRRQAKSRVLVLLPKIALIVLLPLDQILTILLLLPLMLLLLNRDQVDAMVKAARFHLLKLCFGESTVLLTILGGRLDILDFEVRRHSIVDLLRSLLKIG